MVISAVTDFEYSKDWLVTDSHRLSFYHVLRRTPAEPCIHPFDREINVDPGKSFILFSGAV